jgi:opacity protein-like surface antigen
MKFGEAVFILLLAMLGGVGLQLAAPGSTYAEWYAGAYGGISLAGRITNGSLPIYGLNQAQQIFPPASSPPPPGDYLTSNFQLTDSIKLKNSPMFGARVGYFFNAFGFPWAGLELEAFTTTPDIKQQSVSYTNQIVSYRQFLPPVPPPPPQPQSLTCPSPPTCAAGVSFAEAKLRVTTVTLNAVVRYPGKIFQPYAGIGGGLFYFQASDLQVQNLTKTSGSDLQPGLNAFGGLKVFVTEHIAVFGEYKYNRATIKRLDDVSGLKGDYSIMHLLGGIAYHF